MTTQLFVQYAVNLPTLPTETLFRRWSQAALHRHGQSSETVGELTIRIVDEAESSALNQTFRAKKGPTNVLAFPYQAEIPELAAALLGDIVICAPVVIREAAEQNKQPHAHWAHLVIHGVLHLLGYDHQQPQQTQLMEQLEINILHDLGYPNPYGDCYST